MDLCSAILICQRWIVAIAYIVDAQNYIPNCCSRNDGVRVLAPSCNLRIETEPFFGTTFVESPPSLSPPPPAKGTLGTSF